MNGTHQIQRLAYACMKAQDALRKNRMRSPECVLCRTTKTGKPHFRGVLHSYSIAGICVSIIITYMYIDII